MNFINDLKNIISENAIIENIPLLDNSDEFTYVVRYVDIKRRWFVNTKPYSVVVSETLMIKISQLSEQEQLAINDIKNNLLKGTPIVPYLSKQIYESDMNKSDWLLKNFSICHCHLRKTRGFIEDENLLFFMPHNETIYFIDIAKHPKGDEWVNKELLKVIEKNKWFELINYIPNAKTEDRSREYINEHWRKKIIPIQLEDGIVFPNLGVASSCDSNYAFRITADLLSDLKFHQQALEDNNELKDLLKDKEMNFELAIENQCFVAYEETLKIRVELGAIPEFLYYYKEDT